MLAPNDRFNYGDLLFPYVIEHYFSRYFDDIVFVSTTESDLTEKGGVKTKGYPELFKTEGGWENHLIVAGGESLCVGWFGILSYVRNWVHVLYKISSKVAKIPFGRFFYNACDALIRRVYKTNTLFVFSVGKNELSQFKTIAYNALGGSWLLKSDLLDRQAVKNILCSVDYFSVRDEDTSMALEQRDIPHVLCPDTAIMMADIFDEEYLLSKLSISKDMAKTPYVFFQGNLRIWTKKYDLAASQLGYIAQKMKCKICLCPIGTALGHSDHVALQKISHLMDKETFFYINQPNVFDIMWLIKHSKMYIGSSLHGTITAMSFGIPYLGYGPNKLKAYIEQWGNRNNFCKKEQLSCVADEVQTDGHCDDQKGIVLSRFKELSNLYN